jgi:hypothetical protein
MFIDIHTARGFCLPLKNEVFYDLNIKPWISKPEIDLEIRYKTMFDREVKQLLSQLELGSIHIDDSLLTQI